MLLDPSQAPTGLLHGRLVIEGPLEGALGVVLLVHVVSAGAMAAVHAVALEATVMLLLLHAAADVFLVDGTRVSELHRTLLVGLRQSFVASCTWILRRGSNQKSQ